MDIGELAARSGLSASALRYYEEIGLITSIGRHGLRRQFGADALSRIRLVALGKKAGFSLSEIAALFSADGTRALPRSMLRARKGEIERRILELTTLRDVISHVAECPAPNHFECPRFRKLLRIANRKDKTAR